MALKHRDDTAAEIFVWKYRVVPFKKGAVAAFLIIGALFTTNIDAQVVSNSRSNSALNGLVQVIPQCREDMIVVHVRFNPQFRSVFADWIIVGENTRPECRLRGNGELRYVVQIVLRNDPCQTKEIESNVFENTLRIAQFPSIILQDDVNFRFRCSRGTPEVVEFRLPQINPTFDIDRNVLSSSTRDLFPAAAITPMTPINSIDRTRLPVIGAGDGASPFFNRPDFGSSSNLNVGKSPNSLDLNRLAINNDGRLRGDDIAAINGNYPPGHPLQDNGSVNSMVAITLSALLILSVLIFFLCLFVCLRSYQQQRDVEATLIKGVAEITPPKSDVAHHIQTQHLLPAQGRQHRSRGAGQNSSATASPHSQSSSSFSNSVEMRRPTDEDDNGPWWVGKGGNYLVTSDQPSPSKDYIVCAVDVPSIQQQKQQKSQRIQKQQRQQPEQDSERAAASQAFRNALHCAHSRSTELMRAPNSYAEWREKTLKRGRGSNGADLLLESEEADSSQNNSDEGSIAPHRMQHGPKTPPTIRLPDKRPFVVENTQASFLSSIHTPLRSITEVYHAPETRQRVPATASNKIGSHAELTIRENVTTTRRVAEIEFEEQGEDIILQSSDEGFLIRKII